MNKYRPYYTKYNYKTLTKIWAINMNMITPVQGVQKTVRTPGIPGAW